ncbi:hypothetical protein [Saccharopolyspora spinosa]|uniref:Sporulation protein YtfJ n=1 Tax=Saccharopolyspora spinosa TaxID=60894 RepID=A0A2N3XQ92_SACSN|nr:hypothetical protein [Saccharopolyspora spinosa]PKW12835.1 hypothetical protein A8926_0326 [Saccharopolyspora spinosa]
MEEQAARGEILETLAERLGKRQVFGEPVQQGDTTLLPVARVRSGGGRHRHRDDGGFGIGMEASPVGAFSISAGGKVAWHPAVNVNKIVWGGQLALATALVAIAIAFRRKR